MTFSIAARMFAVEMDTSMYAVQQVNLKVHKRLQIQDRFDNNLLKININQKLCVKTANESSEHCSSQ